MSNLPQNKDNAGLVRSLVRWFDSDYIPEGSENFRNTPKQVDWPRTIPFIILHLGCLGVIWVGISPLAVWLAVGLYFFRMFAITGFLHRYFSHKTYSTSRAFQFVMALWCSLAVQRGALWWAYTHRHHHKHSDEEDDKHSPVVDGFWWAHIGWITSKKNFPTDYSKITDLAKYPELVFLNRFDTLIPILLAGSLYGLGAYLGAQGVDTSGAQLLVWGFFISTTVLFHGTSCINSLAHVWGTKRFKTTDDESRNSFILTLITLGEGWHNNHHRYQATTKQGFYWWEFDPTYYLLKMLSWTGLIWGLKGVPESIYEEAEKTKAESQQRA
jgi:stearoyl-CoA desaturase (delta-9 desaturase)